MPILGEAKNISEIEGAGDGEDTHRGIHSIGTGKCRCYNCDAPNFMLDHIANCPAIGITCKACRKVGRFERTSRGVKRGTNQWRGRGRVGLIRDENKHPRSTHSVDNGKIQREQIAWANQQQECGEQISTSSGFNDYMVMSIKKKNAVELKITSARVQVEVSGKKMWLWVDSGSPVTIFSMTDL